jgi:CopG family transcriptional regulator/antitoxin EndoAI
MISIPNTLLQEIDTIAALEKMTRSQFMRDATRLFIEDRRKKAALENMRKGYQEMAAINLALAEEGLFADDNVVAVTSLLVERE